MNEYQKELQALKAWDEIQTYNKPEFALGYAFIGTAGHGYLVVPTTDKYYNKALEISNYGFVGKLAVYLEEDCEMSEFLDYIKGLDLPY